MGVPGFLIIKKFDDSLTTLSFSLICFNKYGMAVQAMNWDGVAADKKKIIDKKADIIAKKLCSKTKPSVEIKTRFMFHMMGMMQKKGWNSSPVETEYWKENGWLDGKKPWDV